jgi:hypothetical protein
MFIRFFKTNNAAAFVFLPLLALTIWGFGFFLPPVQPTENTMPFYDIVSNGISKFHWLNISIALILVLSEAFLLNYIINENALFTKQSYLPALFYLMFMSNNNAMLTTHPLLFANLFIIFAIDQLLNAYRKDKAFAEAFNAGLLVSFATLFYFPYIIFVPVLGIAFILLRPFIWREWIISIMGVLLPYCFVLSYYFWNDSFSALWHQKMVFQFSHVLPKFNFSQSFYFTMIVGWGILLFSFGSLFGGLSGGSQKSKKGLILMIWLFVFSIASVLIAPEITTRSFSAFAIPASIFCANYFQNIKKAWWAELLFLMLFSSIIVNLLIHFF